MHWWALPGWGLLLCLGSGLLVWGLYSQTVALFRESRFWTFRFRKRVWLTGAVLPVVSIFYALFLLGQTQWLWGVFFLIPWTLKWSLKSWQKAESDQIEESSLPFFHAFLGLLRGGIAVPAAFLKSIEAAPGPFSQFLKQRLERRAKGETVSEALERVKRGTPILIYSMMETLQVIYREGLGLIAILSEQVAYLERELKRRKKISQLRASLWGQAVLCALLPWSVFGFSQVLEEGVAGLGSDSVWCEGVVLCVVWQVLGGVCIYRFCRFN